MKSVQFPKDGYVRGEKNAFAVTTFNGWKEIYSEPNCLGAYSSATEDNWAYSIGFQMKAGKVYHASFQLLAPGLSESDNKSESVRFTVGKGQSKEAECIILKDLKNIKYKEWKKVEADFTPQTDGVYYFGFGFTATAANGVGIDDFEVYDNENPFPVEAKFAAYGGLWSNSANHLKDEMRYVYPNQSITFINQSKYATAYQWDTFGDPATTNEENPEVTYSESGDYRPLLNATNAKYTDSFSDVVNVTVLGKEEITDIVCNTSNKYDIATYPEKDVPGTNDYVSGINRYYTTFAEKFELPAEAEASISGVYFRLYLYKAASTNKGKPVKVRLYADKWGAPDPENVFGEYVTTMSNAFGTASIDYEDVARKIKFDKPIKVKGSFYLSVELDESIVPDATTKLALAYDIFRADKIASAYVRVHVSGAAELNLNGGWYCVTDLPRPFNELDKTGFSFYLSPEITFHKTTGTSVNEVKDNKVNVYPAVFESGFTITTKDNAAKLVRVFNANGQVVFEKTTHETSIDVTASDWTAGIYLVKVEGNSTNSSMKIIKK
ncbi:T9SS type A sorting domain-containing protein [Bacteroides salyersiae]|nr:T9SS type A sorting domain-containing protein [Bacteroides salyersiae]